MNFFMRYIIIVAVCVMPFSAWGSEGKPEEKKDIPQGGWKDIKQAPGPKVVEIPKKYNDLVKVFSEYYDARMAGDYKKTYNMESSAYRKATSFDLYNERLKRAAGLMAVRPLEVKPISEKEVMVRASFGYKVAAIDTVKFFQDHWVKEDNAWRHQPKEEN